MLSLTHLENIVAEDLATSGAPEGGWEQYAREVWEDRWMLFHDFPRGLTFIAWRALVRRAAASIGLLD